MAGRICYKGSNSGQKIGDHRYYQGWSRAADAPEPLIQRQAALWDPVLDWAADSLKARLTVASGVMHVAQEPQVLKALHRRVAEMSPFQLAAFHDLVGLSGSLILGFAAVADLHPIEEIWALSRVDETWQEEQWGKDEEAAEHAEIKRQAFFHAKRFFDLCQAAQPGD